MRLYLQFRLEEYMASVGASIHKYEPMTVIFYQQKEKMNTKEEVHFWLFAPFKSFCHVVRFFTFFLEMR